MDSCNLLNILFCKVQKFCERLRDFAEYKTGEEKLSCNVEYWWKPSDGNIW